MTEFDVNYLTGSSELAATLYLPAGDGPFPAVVNVHGGAWTSGGRFNNVATSRALAAAGIAVLAPDFRMPPSAGFPEPVSDINVAVRWLKENARAARTTPDRVGGLGFSSGGHQLTLSALRPADPRWSAIPLGSGRSWSADLAFLVLCYAVLDPVGRYRMAQDAGRQALVDSHHAYWLDEATMVAGSPQAVVAAGGAQALPPMLVIQGADDANLTPDMARTFAATYLAVGGEVELLMYDTAPHGFLERDPNGARGREATGRIIEFIHRHTP